MQIFGASGWHEVKLIGVFKRSFSNTILMSFFLADRYCNTHDCSGKYLMFLLIGRDWSACCVTGFQKYERIVKVFTFLMKKNKASQVNSRKGLFVERNFFKSKQSFGESRWLIRHEQSLQTSLVTAEKTFVMATFRWKKNLKNKIAKNQMFSNFDGNFQERKIIESFHEIIYTNLMDLVERISNSLRFGFVLSALTFLISD